MTKGLEILENLIGNEIFISLGRIQGKKQFANNINVIKKELKALEIITSNQVNVARVNRCCNALQYNMGVMHEERYLNEEEFDLLKEILL